MRCVEVKILQGDSFDRPALLFQYKDKVYTATKNETIENVIEWFSGVWGINEK